jgi:hypothetical protein
MKRKTSGNRLKKGCAMIEATKLGYRVVGTIKAVKGYCRSGHQTGDQMELDGHHAAGLCGFLLQQT